MNKNNTGTSEEKITVSIEAEIKELIPEYLSNRQGDIRCMLEGLDKSNFQAIRIIGHTMKGSGGSYGFNRISQIGLALEQGGQEANAGKIRKSIDELTDYLNRVEVIFE